MNLQSSKIATLLEREISEILRKGARDNKLHEVTITAVKLSNDKSVAKIYYSVLTDEHKEVIGESLTNAVGYIKTELSKVTEMRKVPELRFIYDESIEYGNKIEQLLAKLKK